MISPLVVKYCITISLMKKGPKTIPIFLKLFFYLDSFLQMVNEGANWVIENLYINFSMSSLKQIKFHTGILRNCLEVMAVMEHHGKFKSQNSQPAWEPCGRLQ